MKLLNNHLFGFVMLLAFAIPSCKSSSKKAVDKAQITHNETLVKLNVGSEKIPESATFTITNVSLSGNKLKLSTTHKGGCGNANYTLYWNGMMKKSMPPQIDLDLVLHSEDTCEKDIKKEMTFDISSLLEFAEKSVIRIKGYDSKFTYPEN